MRIFFERPVATAMFYLALSLLGIYSFLNIPLELAPKEDFPQLTIQTNWPGVPPEIIQTQVTSPLEEVASTVKGLRKISSSSATGRSTIILEFEPRTNMEFATLSLSERLSKAKEELPYGARQPWIEPYVPEDFRTEDFLEYTISGDYPLQKLRETVREKLEFGLGSVKGVARVRVTGGSSPEIRIVLDRKKLNSLNIHPYQVLSSLYQRNQTFPAGKIKKGNQEYIFKVSSSIKDIKEIEETIVSYSGGIAIKLNDVAKVLPSFQDIHDINRINGQPTIRMTILKEKGTGTLKVARWVKKRLEEIKKELPQDLIFRVVNDESREIQKNLNDLYRLVAIMLGVVFLIIFLIMRRFLPSLLILSSIFFSVLITFNLIYLFKISMNMLTLGALALGFGMFVDNSIVVFENILRLREKRVSLGEALIRGPREVFLAVLASTLTTVCVFFSFPYFQGRLKMYYLPLAIVISSALAISLFVSFSLVPALSPRLLKLRKGEQKEKICLAYEKFLKFMLGHPLEVLIAVFLIFYGSYKWFKSEVTIGEWFRWYAKEKLSISIRMPPGTDITKTDELVRKFEEKIQEADYEKEMNTNIMAENAYILIAFPPEIENSFRPYLLKEELIQLATQFAGIDIGIYGFDPQGYYSSMGTGIYYDSRIKFYGYNLKKLSEITSELEERLRRNPRIKEIKIVSSRLGWWRIDSFENILKIDKEALRKYEIDPQYLYFHFQALLQGQLETPLRSKISGKEISLSIKFPEAEAMDIKSLQDSLIRTRKGEYLRLSEITTLEERPIAGSIDRENQQFQQTVMWEFRGPSKASEDYRRVVFEGLKLPPGFSASLEETWLITKEEKAQIKLAIIFSLIAVYMILAALYESFIQSLFIMLAVPLSLIGVFVAFVIARYAFDSSAYIGVILLAGIVVNNAILLVDHINLRRRLGFSLLEAIIVGTRERVRPIFMTTSTTVLGMLPMVLIQTEAGKNQIWSSLALCTVGGLVSSTTLILIVIPIFYYYGDRIHFWAYQRFQELKTAWNKY